jgi:hypothetical protein
MQMISQLILFRRAVSFRPKVLRDILSVMIGRLMSFSSSDVFPSKNLEKGDLARGERLFPPPIYVPVVLSTMVCCCVKILLYLALALGPLAFSNIAYCNMHGMAVSLSLVSRFGV